jgi:RNA-directed DNA polymerase
MQAKKHKASVCDFYFNLETELYALQEELLDHSYTPRPLNTFKIFEPKERMISCSHIRDRIVHHAIFNVTSELFETRFTQHSYACRIGKGTHLAIKQAQIFSQKSHYFLKCDVSKYFASIDHNVLKGVLSEMIPCSKTQSLCSTIIDHGSKSGNGLPIGNLSSQYFANLYLGELDIYVQSVLGIKSYLRYMDDFIIFVDSKALAQVVLNMIVHFLNEKLILTLNQRVLMIAHCATGLPFLGFRIYPKLIRIKRENLVRMRKKMKKCLLDQNNEKSIQSMQSMMAHIKHANTYSLRVKEFVTV